MYPDLHHLTVQHHTIFWSLSWYAESYCTTWHSILISIPLHSALLRKRSWQKSVVKTDKIVFSLVIHFVFKFWAYNKTIFWEVGVSSIFSTWFLLHNLCFSKIFTKLGFYNPTLIGYISDLFLLHSHMTWGIAFVRVFHLHYFNACTVHLVLCLFQPTKAQIYITMVSLCIMYTPTCFDICVSSSGSFTCGPH